MHNRTMMMKCPAVKVYTASVDCLEDPALFREWLIRVPALRREKAESLRNPAVRRLSLGAGALLTCALLEHFTRPDETLWDPADPEGSGKDNHCLGKGLQVRVIWKRREASADPTSASVQ